MAGPAIKVEPEALLDLAQKLRQQSQQVQEVYAKTKAQADVATGERELQNSLDAYNRMWDDRVGGLARVDEGLVTLVEASARTYRRNEQALADMLQPGGPGGDVSTPESVPDYVQGLMGNPQGNAPPPGASGDAGMSSPKSVPDYIEGLAEGGSGRGGNQA